MTSKRNRNRLIVAGAAAAASVLAFYFAWKAFNAYDSDPDEDVPGHMDGDEKEHLDMENLMKINEEKSVYQSVKIEGVAEEEDSGYRVEEFEQFIADEYGAVLADGMENSLHSQDYQEPTEKLCARNDEEVGDLKVGFVVKEEASLECLFSCSDGFDSCSMGNETEEGSTHPATGQAGQQQLQLDCSSIEGMNSEALLTEFFSSRDVGFDELSMQDLSEGDVIFSSDSQKESDGQNSPDFEFDSCNSSIKNVPMSPEGLRTDLWDMSDVDGLPRQSSEEHHHEFKVGDLKKPSSVVEITLEEELDSSINNGVAGLGATEGLEVEPLNPLDVSLKTSSAIGSKDPDYGISADEEQVFPQPELNIVQCRSLVGFLIETSDSEYTVSSEADRHVLEGGISSSNRSITGQCNSLLEDPEGKNSARVGFNNIFNANRESSSVARCDYHPHQQYAESGNHKNDEAPPKLDVDLSTMNGNIDNLTLQSPVNVVDSAGDKDVVKSASHVFENGKRLDVEVTQRPKVDRMDSNNHGLEGSTSDSVGTQSSSSDDMACDTLSSYVFEDALNSSNIAISELGGAQKGADLGEQFNGQSALLQTFDNPSKNIWNGNLKFEELWSQLLSLPQMNSDAFSEHPLEGIRRNSNFESILNGHLTKQTEGLGAYDAFLADPSLSSSMKSQVSRAKAIAQKLYAAREG